MPPAFSLVWCHWIVDFLRQNARSLVLLCFHRCCCPGLCSSHYPCRELLLWLRICLFRLWLLVCFRRCLICRLCPGFCRSHYPCRGLLLWIGLLCSRLFQSCLSIATFCFSLLAAGGSGWWPPAVSRRVAALRAMLRESAQAAAFPLHRSFKLSHFALRSVLPFFGACASSCDFTDP